MLRKLKALGMNISCCSGLAGWGIHFPRKQKQNLLNLSVITKGPYLSSMMTTNFNLLSAKMITDLLFSIIYDIDLRSHKWQKDDSHSEILALPFLTEGC